MYDVFHLHDKIKKTIIFTASMMKEKTMKRIFFFWGLVAVCGMWLATGVATAQPKPQVYTVSDGIRFNEGTLPLRNGGILLSNFGTDTLNPLNREGRGLYLKKK